LIVACSHERDSQTGPGRAYVEEAVSYNFDTALGDAKAHRCVYAGLVDSIGLDLLIVAGVTPAEQADALWCHVLNFRGATESLSGLEVSESQAREAVDVYFGCVDLVQLWTNRFITHTAEDLECFRSAIENNDSELRAVAKEELLHRGEADLSHKIYQLVPDECQVAVVDPG
jgi:hypothetical protein